MGAPNELNTPLASASGAPATDGESSHSAVGSEQGQLASQYQSGAPGRSITMYSTPWCGDCRRVKRWFYVHGVSYEEINIDRAPEAAAYVVRLNGGMRSVPTIIFPRDSILVEPNRRARAAAGGSAGIQPAVETNTATKTARATRRE